MGTGGSGWDDCGSRNSGDPPARYRCPRRLAASPEQQLSVASAADTVAYSPGSERPRSIDRIQGETLGPVAEVTPMSLILNTIGAIQLCAGCTVDFEPRVTLGAAEDPTGPGTFAELLDMGDRGYLVSSEVLGGVVILYDSEGRYQRELTREGDGPGELREPPKFAGGPGGIILMEPGSVRLHLYTSDLEFIRTSQVPGAVFLGSIKPSPATGGWLVSYCGVDYGETGILLLDQEANVVRSMQAGEVCGDGGDLSDPGHRRHDMDLVPAWRGCSFSTRIWNSWAPCNWNCPEWNGGSPLGTTTSPAGLRPRSLTSASRRTARAYGSSLLRRKRGSPN